MTVSDQMNLQHTAFETGEADAYFKRNHVLGVHPTPGDHGVIQAINAIHWPSAGRCLDLGGSAGGLSAAIAERLCQWSFVVTDPSAAAVAAGQQAFPSLTFLVETAEALSLGNHGQYDLVVVSAVLHWVDRKSLAQVVANIDAVLRNGGRLIIHDFDPAFPRMNAYKHHPDLWTFKQHYAAIFTHLGIYDLVYHRSSDSGSAANHNDPYDRRWSTSVLQKTLDDRYCR